MPTAGNRTALVTGCSEVNHLGHSIALELKSRGWSVYASIRGLKETEATTELTAKGCQVLRMDVEDEAAIRAARDLIAKQAGSINLIVNNAAIGGGRPLLDCDDAAIIKMFNVNALGALRVTRTFLPLLLKSKEENGNPVVVNVGSVARFGCPWQGAYSISKAGMACMSDVLRLELENFGVKVVHADMGGMRYNFNKPADLGCSSPSGLYWNTEEIDQAFEEGIKKLQPSYPEPKDVAKSIVDQVERGKSSIYAGGSASILRYIPLFPGWVLDRVWRGFSRSDLMRPKREVQ